MNTMRLVTFAVSVIFSCTLFPCETRAHVPLDNRMPNAIPDYVNELNRRLKNVEDLRANDLIRFDELEARIVELKNLRVRDELEARIVELEDLRVRDELAMSRRVTELEKHHAMEKVKITRLMEDLAKSQINDVSELPKGQAEIADVRETDELKLTECVKELKTMQERVNILKTQDVNVLQSNLTFKPRVTSVAVDDGGETASSLEENEADVTFPKVPRISPTRNRRVGDTSSAVAFSATPGAVSNDPSVGQTVIFNKLLTNVGTAYSSNTGIFTCTQPGVYVFSWTITVAHPNYLNTELMRNGKTIGETTAAGSIQWGTGSNLVALQLTGGDEVWVRVVGHTSGADIRTWGTSFTGFLLQ